MDVGHYILAGTTVIAGAIATIYGAVHKSNSKSKLSENEQAFQLYKNLVTTLQAQIQNVEVRLHDVEKVSMEYQQKNLALQAKVDSLLAENTTLKERIVILEKQQSLKN